MACLFGHKWKGCKCEKCGKTRDEGHDIQFCTCRICGAKVSENHDWQSPSPNKCYERCSVCHKERRKEHSYIPLQGRCEEQCSRCGEIRKTVHKWQNGRCTVCEERQTDPEAARLVAVLESDPNWENRRDAATALAGHACDDSLEALIHALKSDDSWVVRFSCARALGDMGDERAVPPLIEALSDGQNTVISYAAKALGKLKNESGIEPMLNVMRGFRGGDFTGVSGVIESLGMMGDVAIPRLLELADSDISEFAIRALAETGSPKVMNVLIQNARDDNREGYFRALMANGIGKIGGEAALNALKDLLQNASEPDLVKALVRNLEKLGVSKDQLGDTLRDAEVAAASKLLTGLRALRKGMPEKEADELVGGANFGMGANQVHETSFGSFQLLVTNGIVYDMLYVNNVIDKIEKYLNEEKTK